MWNLNSNRDSARLGAKGLLTLAVALALTACAEKKPEQASQQQPPAQVGVVRVAPQTVSLDRVYAARAQTADDVEIRARVQGTLLKRNYTEGSQVKAGAALFQIDSAPFEARVQQAEADLNRAQAQQRQAEREWTRASALFKDNAVSARDRDTALSTVELAQAGVATARAQLRAARIQLDYTQVKAPISGYAGMRALSEGNLVAPNSLLTTIRRLDPVHVVFSMPEADAIAHRQRAQKNGSAESPKLTATLTLSNGEKYEHEGVIDFTATAMDPETSTMQARATFSNPRGLLLPGQFVRVSVKGLEISDTIMIPPQAVGEGPQGPTVFVVDDKNLAQMRSVKLGANTPEGQIVTAGISAGDRIVVEGMAKVKAGSPVVPTDAVAVLTSGASK